MIRLNKYLKEYLDLQFFSKRLIKTVAYIRVSHEEQKRHGFSVSAQKEGLQKYANEKGYMIIDWYIDEAKSARKKSRTRKELMRLVEDAKQKKFEMIIFKCIDRWFRNIAEYYKIQEVLDDNNINWECSEEEYDTTTREGRLKLNLYLMLAQDEADKGSERIIYVFDNKIKQGEAIVGTQSLPYGIKVELIGEKKRVVIDKELKPIVDDVFNFFELTGSKRKTFLMIQEKYDTDITYRIVKDMFSKTMYYGAYRDNEKYVYGETHLTKERWLRIQEILKNNYRSTSTKRTYLFSGLIKCCKCRRALCGQTTSRRNNTYIKVYYRCNGKYIFNDCDSLNVSEDKLEKLLLEDIKPKLKRYIASFEVNDKTKSKPKIDIKKLEKEIDRINKMYQKGRMKEEDYDREYQEIENKINKAKSYDTKPKDLTYIKDILNSDIEAIYEKLTRDEKVMFWRSFISKIRMKENSKEIYRIDFI